MSREPSSEPTPEYESGGMAQSDYEKILNAFQAARSRPNEYAGGNNSIYVDGDAEMVEVLIGDRLINLSERDIFLILRKEVPQDHHSLESGIKRINFFLKKSDLPYELVYLERRPLRAPHQADIPLAFIKLVSD